MKVRKGANYSPSQVGATPAPGKSSSGGGSGPIWSMSSLMEVLPDSPSPICSSPRNSSLDFSSQFFTPRHQNGGFGGVIGGSRCEPTIEVHSSVPDHRRDLVFFLPSSDSDFNCSTDKWKQLCSSPTRKSMSTLYESTLTTMDQQQDADAGLDQGNLRKSQKHQHYRELIYEGSSTPTQEEEFHSRLARPRPYQEFLDEVQTQQHGSEIDSWKKAKQLILQSKLRRKEAAITNWEMEQKNKARAEMEIIERKIEMRRAKALKKIQKKIVQANKEAEKQRAHERRAALRKMERVARLSDKIQIPECIVCLKLHKLCRSK